MVDSLKFEPFAGAAACYAQFRPPYAPQALHHVVAALGLNASSRVLDLGCGPGTLSIPLSNLVHEVVAVDPDPSMLAEGRARGRDRGNIRWVHASAEALPQDLGQFRAVTMGLSFHWMQRDAVLERLNSVTEEGGGLAVLSEGARSPQESWEIPVARTVAKYLGPRTRHLAKSSETDHRPSLSRSAHFADFSVAEFQTEIIRDVSSILGCVYSGSDLTRERFGERADLFEDELCRTLLSINPSGTFVECLETQVIIARKVAIPS